MASPKTVTIYYKDFDYASFAVYHFAIGRSGRMAISGVKYLIRNWDKLNPETQLYILWDLHLRFNLLPSGKKQCPLTREQSRVQQVGDPGVQYLWKQLYDGQEGTEGHPGIPIEGL